MEFDATISLDVVVILLVGIVAVRWLEKRMDRLFPEVRELEYAETPNLRADLRRVEGKVDDCSQRVARLEGIILAREDMVDTITETS